MHTLTMSQFIGKIGTVNQGGLYVDVKVLDAKHAYGCMRFLVSPMAGSGEVWVSAVRVRAMDDWSKSLAVAVSDEGFSKHLSGPAQEVFDSLSNEVQS